MAESKQSFPEGVKKLARAASTGARRKALPEELIAYLDGDLSRTEAEHLQNLLTLDRDSVAALLDLEKLSRMDAGTAASSAENHVPSWEGMQARLKTEGLGRTAPWPLRGHAPERSRVSPSWRLVLAAALAPVATVLVVWMIVSDSQVGMPTGPGINVPYYILLPEDSGAVRSIDNEELISPGEHGYLLILHVGDRQDFPDYRVEIEDDQGGKIWTADGLEPSPYGTFSLIVPSAFLKVGLYRVLLKGVEEHKQEVVASYRFELGLE